MIETLTTATRGLLVLALAGSAQAQARPAPTAAATVAELTNSACYALASGAVTMPPDGPEALGRTIKAVESFGLSFGVPDDAMRDPALTPLISQATLGSKTLPDGLVLFADTGARGCRIVLLADARAGLTDAVAAGVTTGGWRAVPEMTATRGTIERRAFLRRDKAGTPYLLNLMTVVGQPGRLRLFTTVARIPPNVALPAGY